MGTFIFTFNMTFIQGKSYQDNAWYINHSYINIFELKGSLDNKICGTGSYSKMFHNLHINICYDWWFFGFQILDPPTQTNTNLMVCDIFFSYYFLMNYGYRRVEFWKICFVNFLFYHRRTLLHVIIPWRLNPSITSRKTLLK